MKGLLHTEGLVACITAAVVSVAGLYAHSSYGAGERDPDGWMPGIHSGTHASVLSLARSHWPKFRADLANTGHGVGRGTRGKLRWKYKARGSIGSSPALGSRGTVYVGADDGRVYALDGRSGRLRWVFQTRGPVQSSPAVDSREVVYVGSSDGSVYALSGTDGHRIWAFAAGGEVVGSPSLGPHSMLYIGCVPSGSSTSSLLALDARTGTCRWRFMSVAAGEAAVEGAPAIARDGMLYFGCADQRVYAMAADSGHRKWEFRTGRDVASSPALGPRAMLYVGSGDGRVYSLNRFTGKEIWTFRTNGFVYASPAIGPDGTVYVGSYDGSMYALNGMTGRQKWRFSTGRWTFPSASSPNWIQSSVAVGRDGTIYFGCFDGRLYALDGSTGRMKWTFKVGHPIDSSPAIGADGTIYFGAGDGSVYAVR